MNRILSFEPCKGGRKNAKEGKKRSKEREREMNEHGTSETRFRKFPRANLVSCCILLHKITAIE